MEDQPELRDAESRVAAVKALAAVASQLLGNSQRQPLEEQGPISAMPQHATGASAGQAATATAAVPPPVSIGTVAGSGGLPLQRESAAHPEQPGPDDHAPGAAASRAATATAAVPPPVGVSAFGSSGSRRLERKAAAHLEQPGPDESALKDGCTDPGQILRNVRECVADALLQAAEDYSIDNRCWHSLQRNNCPKPYICINKIINDNGMEETQGCCISAV